MGNLNRIITGIVLITLWVISLHTPSSAGVYRDLCKDPVSYSPPLPVESLPFQAIRAEHFQDSALSTHPVSPKSLKDSFDRQGKFNEMEGGAIILVTTNKNQRAKLLVNVGGTDLLIREFVTYDPGGEPTAQDGNLWLSEGGRLDLDRGTDNPPVNEADLRWERAGTSRILRPLNGARLKVLDPIVAVPVIAHFMNKRSSPWDLNTILWTTKLQELFAPEGKINKVWKQAGVFFFLSRVETCTFSVRDFLPEESTEPGEGIPSPLSDCRSLFRRITRAYNFPTNRVSGLPEEGGKIYGVDLYLWWTIGERGWGKKIFGYAAEQRKDGPNHGPGAIWLNAVACVTRDREPGENCGLGLAHEAGHFLGLCHVCATAEVTPPEERGQCGFCRDIRECSATQRELLMRDDAGGERLTADDIRRTRKKAIRHRWQEMTPTGPQ